MIHKYYIFQRNHKHVFITNKEQDKSEHEPNIET